jgi:DNA-binding transcriptional LysR family regulator
MDLRTLRCFVAVAEELHFGRAALRLHLSQPPLSRTIRNLEVELGVVLLERTRRHVALTHAGCVLLDHSRDLLRGVDGIAESTRRASRGEIGRLSIGFILAATHHALPLALRAFRRRMPDVEIILKEMPVREQLAALDQGELELGFLRPPIDPARFEALTLTRDRLIAAFAEGHPLARSTTLRLSQLSTQPFVMPTPHRSPLYGQIIAACTAQGFTPRAVQYADHLLTTIGLVRAGIGVTLLPQSVQALRPAGVELRPIRGLDTRAEIVLAWRRNGLSPMGEAFRLAAQGIAREKSTA